MNLQELKKEMPVIFDQVKKNVRKVYGRHRAGLNLGLIEMGMYRGGFIGGMHVHPGTDIVMNKTPLKIILREQPDEIVWAYTYHILLHEYIHSLGFLDEQTTQQMTYRISKDQFGMNHIITKLASNMEEYFPNLVYPIFGWLPQKQIPSIEIIQGFDTSNTHHYIT